MNILINNKLKISIILLLVLCVLPHLFGINIEPILYIITYFFIFAFASPEDIFYLVSFTIPLNYILSEIAYIWLFAIVFLIVKTKSIQPKRAILIALLSGVEIFNHFCFQTGTNRMMGYLFCMAITFYMVYESRFIVDSIKIVKMFQLGALAFLCIFIAVAVQFAPSNWIVLLSTGIFRFGGTKADVFGDITVTTNANVIAYISVTSIACNMLFSKFWARFSKIEKFAHVICLVISVFVGALTISRSWFLVFFICVLLYIYGTLNNPSSFIKLIFMSFIGCGVIVTCFPNVFDSIYRGFYSRLTNEGVYTASGRVELFVEYFNVFLSNDRFLFLGTGVTDYREILGLAESMHNGIQQIFVCNGIIFGTLYLVALFLPILYALRKKTRLIFFIPVVSVILFTQTIQFLNPWTQMLPYVVGIYALKIGLQNDNGVLSITS